MVPREDRGQGRRWRGGRAGAGVAAACADAIRASDAARDLVGQRVQLLREVARAAVQAGARAEHREGDRPEPGAAS